MTRATASYAFGNSVKLFNVYFGCRAIKLADLFANYLPLVAKLRFTRECFSRKRYIKTEEYIFVFVSCGKR